MADRFRCDIDAHAAVHLKLANPMIDIQQFENIKQKHGSYAS
jgi:hypothetical protein